MLLLLSRVFAYLLLGISLGYAVWAILPPASLKQVSKDTTLVIDIESAKTFFGSISTNSSQNTPPTETPWYAVGIGYKANNEGWALLKNGNDPTTLVSANTKLADGSEVISIEKYQVIVQKNGKQQTIPLQAYNISAQSGALDSGARLGTNPTSFSQNAATR